MPQGGVGVFFFMYFREMGICVAFGSAWGREKGTCMGGERLGLWKNEFSQQQEVGASPELILIPGMIWKSWGRQRTEGLH